MKRSRKLSINIIVLAGAILVLAVSYVQPRVANISALVLWALVLALCIYAVAIWVYRWRKGESPSHFGAYPKSLIRFAYDDDSDENSGEKTKASDRSKG